MTGEKIIIWNEDEYSYPAAYGFIPFLTSYIHEDREIHPAMLVVPGGGYRDVSPSEAHLPAMEFYSAGYNVFVLAYTVNLLDELKAPLGLQPLKDISRAVRILRKRAQQYAVDPSRVAVCGFSAGGHLCGSLCVHGEDVEDESPEYEGISNRPDAAVLAYPVITSGEYAHRDSFTALFGKDSGKKDLDYMSLEKHVKKDTPPCFLWQTVTDLTVPVENSYLFAMALKKAGVPFAHHVFPEGVHGLSVATSQWLERDFSVPYTHEQIRMLAAAIERGETVCPKEKGEEILNHFGLDGTKKEKWDPITKEQIRQTLPQVGAWPKLAEQWLGDLWKYGA
ncbi:alpha/beta hydrolase [Ruminococcus sp. CLA-AA-H200]|uniref:Alpha/beta hydrolase n=1 Tax=Ruminococcus turbiniformis TaxID=2881258 RepID=A0ABS8FTH3_9FIRM|nr:alpha/beta hydrolase [Ruminococcus turbiniformis]MCC2253277.1 alpha/beta hydrolase [Ruminococcus turbiniformis]